MKQSALFFIAVVVLIFGCAIFKSKPYKRAIMKKSDRELYITDTGWNLNWRLKKAFIDGQIVSGMPYDLVELLYGEAELTIKCPLQNLMCDKIFEYRIGNSYIVGSVSIKDDTVVKATGQLADPSRL